MTEKVEIFLNKSFFVSEDLLVEKENRRDLFTLICSVFSTKKAAVEG